MFQYHCENYLNKRLLHWTHFEMIVSMWGLGLVTSNRVKVILAVFYVITQYSRVASQAVLTPIYQTTGCHSPSYNMDGQPAFESVRDKPFFARGFHSDSGVPQTPGKHKPYWRPHETLNFIIGRINILCEHIPNLQDLQVDKVIRGQVFLLHLVFLLPSSSSSSSYRHSTHIHPLSKQHNVGDWQHH